MLDYPVFSERAGGAGRLVRAVTLVVCAGLCLSATVGGGCKKEGPAGAESDGDSRRPDVVFIVIDALRADRLGCYGCARSNSPFLDSIAQEGVRFERVIAPAPWTQPAMASIFASVYPGVHKVLSYEQAYKTTFEDDKKVAVFDESFVTLAERLREEGYETAGFSANPFILAEYGFAQGFDHFDSSFADTRTPGAVINKAAGAYLDRRTGEKPLFLYLHYMDVHGPYDAGPEYIDPLLDEVEKLSNKRRLTPEEIERLGYLFAVPREHTDYDRHDRLSNFREYWVARYDAGIRLVDDHLRALRDDLSRRGVWDGAMVIITSDHGEALCEHGWWDHGFSVYDTDLHVPLIWRFPGEFEAGRTLRHRVRLIDLMPTLLHALGLSIPDRVQGVSLLERIRTGAEEGPLQAFAEAVKMGPEQKAMYAGAWKLKTTPAAEARELFHIAKDPGEMTDRSDDQPEAVVGLAELLDEQLRENELRSRGLTPQLREPTPEQLKRLKELGYVGD